MYAVDGTYVVPVVKGEGLDHSSLDSSKSLGVWRFLAVCTASLVDDFVT